MFFVLAVSGVVPAGAAFAQEARGVLDAAKVALEDFRIRLSHEPATDWKWGPYVADICNYAIGLSETSGAYIVVINLRDKPGVIDFNGGRARYIVDKKSLKIVNFTGYE